MRFNTLLVSGAVLLAVGSAAPAQGDFSQVQAPDPGLYRTSMTVLELEVPNLPDSALTQMRQMIEQQSATEECEAMEDDFLDFDDMGGMGQDCTRDSLETSANSFAMTMSCQTPDGGTSTMAIQGTTRSDGMDGTMEVNAQMQGMGEMHMRMAITSQRIGDCPG